MAMMKVKVVVNDNDYVSGNDNCNDDYGDNGCMSVVMIMMVAVVLVMIMSTLIVFF